MALQLAQSSNLTACFGAAGFANSGAANSQVLTATAVTLSTAGVASNFAIRSTAVYASTNDARTGVAPPAILGAQAAVVVAGVVAGALVFTQGPIVSFPAGSIAGDVSLQVPPIPAGFVPIAYQVIKNKNTAGTAPWTYANATTGLFNASNLSFETAVQLCQLPGAAVSNASA